MSDQSEGLVRAADNKGALINTDNQALQAYKQRRHKFEQLNNIESILQRLSECEKRIAFLESKYDSTN